jgi:hypothetical protein
MVRMRTLVALGAILGGLCWIATYVADSSDGLLEVVWWVGLVLMTVAFLGAGVRLVRTGTVWLQMVVGLATPALVWSVVWAFKSGDADPEVVDGVVGALTVVFGAVVALRRTRGGSTVAAARPGRRRAA